MKNTHNRLDRMARPMRILAIFMVPVIALMMATAPNVWADDEGEFDVAELFFELNDTDGDLGIHALVDGEPWKELEIEDKRGREMLEIEVKGRLKRQGLTELFFESAEPNFDDLPPARFFRRFQAGTYEIEGETLDGGELESEVELTHVMPAPPSVIVNGLPMAMQCDEDEPGYDAPEVTPSVTIAWEAVTMSHPDSEGGGAGIQPPVPVTIVNYEVVIEVESMGGFVSKVNVILPPDTTSFVVPEEMLGLGENFKYEVLAREESFNQTAVESCFVLE